MKVAIPVNDKSMEASVSESFGRTPYYLIYDTESKESVFLDNSAIASQGGAGIKAAQIVVDHRVNALITPRCGENAAEIIQAANIKLFKTINDSIKDNLAALIEGKLALLEEIHAGFHGHGGN
ncbi:NifB/NifX family molybdenum-iron cluster-binding protein [Desulfosporosinus sp. FKB]|uniref:NifB/NifX family molybdenum-iron cluster-binding protein n=1 Tax=Desulfosporosinus sp. FKB TaxID=1969835 RepID=UPI000B4978FA|nr:NifB/NifX family molybdenum-iron cluster-binding protein [Desulfosporosinus sp. FKB]